MYKERLAHIHADGAQYIVNIKFIHYILEDLLSGKKNGLTIKVKFSTVEDKNKFSNSMDNSDIWVPIFNSNKCVEWVEAYHIKDTPSSMIKIIQDNKLDITFSRVMASKVISRLTEDAVISNEFNGDKCELRRFKAYCIKADKIISAYLEGLDIKQKDMWSLRDKESILVELNEQHK